MCVLNLLLLLSCGTFLGEKFLSIGLLDIIGGHPGGLFRDTGRVCTKIGDQTYGSLTLDIHALIQLLRKTHRLLGGEVQCLACLLLQCRRSKGKGGLLQTLTLLDL